MNLGRIAIIGTGGLLGEIMAIELARFGDVTNFADKDINNYKFDSSPDVIVYWREVSACGEIRAWFRAVLPAQANPVLVFLSQKDPCTYFTRLRGTHVERRRIGFDDVVVEIAGQIAAGPPTIAPVQAGSR